MKMCEKLFTVISEIEKTECTRRSDLGTPLHSRSNQELITMGAPSPQFHRVEVGDKVAILICEVDGWVAQTEEGTLLNPWTGKPFSTVESASKALKFRLKHGKWPNNQTQKCPRCGCFFSGSKRQGYQNPNEHP